MLTFKKTLVRIFSNLCNVIANETVLFFHTLARLIFNFAVYIQAHDGLSLALGGTAVATDTKRPRMQVMP